MALPEERTNPSVSLQILSDLHFECDPDGGEAFVHGLPVVGDVLILAGDLMPLRTTDLACRVFNGLCARFAHVVFVPGNHEYYRSHPAAVWTRLIACAQRIPNLHVLNPGIVTIDGIRFVGATLWFPDTPDEILYRNALADFRMIADFEPWVHDTHVEHLAFLKVHVRPGDVVVTHHLPHPRSIDPQYAGSALNRFFLAGDAAELVERAGARLWVHGHTHATCDYVIGKTRVVCNPRGYPVESANGFDRGRVVKV